MSCKHHTSNSEAVTLDLPATQVSVLRRIFTSCLNGIRGDQRRRRQIPRPASAGQDADAYERILAGLDRGEMFLPDEEAREAVQAIAISTDQENDYTTVVAEHAALYGLLARLGGGRDPEFGKEGS